MPNPLKAAGRIVVLPYWSDLGSIAPKVRGLQSWLVLRMMSFSRAANVAWNSGACLATSSHSHSV